MTESDDDIFEWIMTFEDDCLRNVREEVIKTAEYNYGEKGRKIAEKYYKQIDGEDDYEDLSGIDDDCNDCKERAKKLIEISEFTKIVIEILSDDKITQIIKNTDINCDEIKRVLINKIDQIIKTTLFEIDDETKNKILIRILLENCKKLQQNDNSSGQKIR